MIKTFDAVAFMRKRREELSREYAHLLGDDIRRRIGEALEDDPLWRRVKDRIAQPETLRPPAVRERRP